MANRKKKKNRVRYWGIRRLRVERVNYIHIYFKCKCDCLFFIPKLDLPASVICPGCHIGSAVTYARPPNLTREERQRLEGSKA
jgi:hypothetical protein